MPKVTLSQTYLYAGKHYGPGEVEIENEEAAKALTEREKAVQGAPAAPAPAPAPGEMGDDGLSGEADPDAETQPRVPRRAPKEG